MQHILDYDADPKLIYASFGRRLSAFIADLLPIQFGLLAIATMLTGSNFIWNTNSDIFRPDFYIILRMLLRSLGMVIWIIYSIFMDASAQQGTYGKRWVGIKVVDQQGQRLSMRQSVVRNSSKILSYLSIMIGFVWALFNPKRQALHDLIADTVVIEASN